MIPVLVRTLNAFFMVLEITLFVRIILSWFPIGKNNRFMQILFSVTEPVLAPIRNLVHRSPLGGPGMVLDFSPLIAFMLLRILRSIIIGLLLSL